MWTNNWEGGGGGGEAAGGVVTAGGRMGEERVSRGGMGLWAAFGRIRRVDVSLERSYFRRPRRANVAQSVEQLTRNEQVTGSSPVVGSGKRGPISAERSRSGLLGFNSVSYLIWPTQAGVSRRGRRLASRGWGC